MKRILVTGACGQIGSDLVVALRERYGAGNVLATDIKEPTGFLAESGPFERLDCLDAERAGDTIGRHRIDTIYHLAAILSATGEKNPILAWDVNMNGLYNVLEAARAQRCTLFIPSSIGAFGPSTPKNKTPQDTIQRPETIYGVTKVAGELLCDYYFKRFGLDTRGLRFPGLISYAAEPGGGTTDYAVDIFYEAIRKQNYLCYLSADTAIDMMYMPDAIRSMIELMEADPSRLIHRNAFNVTAFSFTPADLAAAIKKLIPDFTITYDVDPIRQAIADSWPDSIDDSAARKEWGWKPAYTLEAMTADMLDKLSARLR